MMGCDYQVKDHKTKLQRDCKRLGRTREDLKMGILRINSNNYCWEHYAELLEAQQILTTGKPFRYGGLEGAE